MMYCFLGTVMRHKKDLEERIAQGLSVSPLDETPGRRGSVSSTASHPESLPDTPEDEPADTATMVTQPVTTENTEESPWKPLRV